MIARSRLGISAHSLDILEAAGVSRQLLAEGLKVRHAHFHVEARELLTIDFSLLPHRYNFLLSLPQRDTERIMADTLATFGIDVEWRTELVGLTQHADKVEARLANGVLSLTCPKSEAAKPRKIAVKSE